MDRTKYIVCNMFLVLFCSPIGAQETVLKTNGLYWVTATPNMAFEFKISKHLSIELPAGYNAWKSSTEGRSLRHYAFQPELRYWFCRPFEGHMVGVHAHYAKYNMGNMPFMPETKGYMYKGDLWGGGLSYGYQWVLGTRWGLEASIGLGYAYINYTKYIEGECCAEVVSRVKKHYVGPTKVAVSLIYMIH